jgi:aminoglycoside phosphotransferase
VAAELLHSHSSGADVLNTFPTKTRAHLAMNVNATIPGRTSARRRRRCRWGSPRTLHSHTVQSSSTRTSTAVIHTPQLTGEAALHGAMGHQLRIDLPETHDSTHHRFQFHSENSRQKASTWQRYARSSCPASRAPGRTTCRC